MEAKSLPEQEDQISVTATREEWHEVINDLIYLCDGVHSESAASLIHWLINQGVYG